MSEANIAVIAAFIEDVLNQKRLERADDLVTENFVERDPLPGQAQGREGLKAILQVLWLGFPDMHWTVKELIAEREKVVTRFVSTATHRGAFLGIPATGRSVEAKCVVIEQLENGRMSESRIQMGTKGLMQQRGVVPGPLPVA